MTLRIGCDLDGTLADMESALHREAERLFGRGVRLRAPEGVPVDAPPSEDSGPIDTPDGTEVPSRTLTAREIQKLWNEVGETENFWGTLAEIEAGVVARLAQLAATHRWEVVFLTQRMPTAGETSQLQTQRWLRQNGFEFPSVLITGGARGRLAAELRLRAVLDDRMENCLDVAAESKARPMLIWRGPVDAAPPGAERLGIDTFHSVTEALERLEDMTAAKGRDRSLNSRIRKAIGL